MRFRVIPNSSSVPSEGRDVGYLWADNWNDWFKYRTLYVLTYFDTAGNKHDIGNIKIGQFNWNSQQDRPRIPSTFDRLSQQFFSLGQDSSYYRAIFDLGPELSDELLPALRDVVADAALYSRALDEDVMGISLLRSVTARSIEGQFRRILAGGTVLTEYSFRYEAPIPQDERVERLTLEFEVTPDSTPPTNIHVLIG